METLLSKFGISLMWIDWLIAGGIVAFVELVVKRLICKKQDGKIFKIIYTAAPVVLGVLVYVVYALIAKLDVSASLKIGIAVGGISAWFYDAIWAYLTTTGKEKGISGAKEIAEDISEIAKTGKSKK